MTAADDAASRAAMEHARPWTPLSELVGAKLPLEQILGTIRGFNRRDGLFTLSCIAADLANTSGGILGKEARSWTHDLLVQRAGSPNALEDAVSRAVARLGKGTAITHGHVLFVLQHLLLTLGSDEGRRPDDGQLAFLMLALNDYLPSWSEETPALSPTEATLASMFFATIFNESSDDPLRFLMRLVGIVGGDISGGPISADEWRAIQAEAFGCSFEDYVEQFLVPVFMLSRSWTSKEPPVLAPAAWTQGNAAALYARWFQEAALPDRAASWKPSTEEPLALPRVFFRTPFVSVGDNVLCLSPWHMRDHARLGTWARLNLAAKKFFRTDSIQRFSATFGYLFERWCANVARTAAARGPFKGKLVLPSSPGAEDEIEDVVVLDRDRVALLSAKSSLVPESQLKCARSLGDAIVWLRRFFFEDPQDAKASGHRGGALWLLDRKIQRIRSGEYAHRGIKRNALILPVVVSFDNVGESSILYKWLQDECARLGILSARPLVRPVTILTPDDYEAVFALASRGKGLCDLLVEKTRTAERLARVDWFLHRGGHTGRELRLPSMELEFEDLVGRAMERMRRAGIFAEQTASAQDAGG
jgi:hypothetical protein